MRAVIHKTVETEVKRPPYTLRVTDANADSLIVEYAFASQFTERFLHREAIQRALKVTEAKGWNPATCTYEVMRRAEDNSPECLSWWEAVEAMGFNRALDVATGATALDLRPAEAVAVNGGPHSADAATPCCPPAAEKAGEKTARESARDLLAALFGCN